MKKKFTNLSVQGYARVKKSNGRIIFLPIIILPIMPVIIKRRKVANELYKKTDTELLAACRLYVGNINDASVTFVNPVPALVDVTTCGDQFESLIATAASGDHHQVSLKKQKREALINILSTLSNYVEDTANSEDNNPDPGSESLILLAGMRPKPFGARKARTWDVVRGPVDGSIVLTADAYRNAFHEWEYTYTPMDDNSWVALPSTTKSRTIAIGLTRGAFVSCRHRITTSAGTTDWQGHDPVVVG